MDNILPFDRSRFKSQMELEDSTYVDMHGKNDVPFGSLINDGWDWGKDKWTCYSMKPETLALVRDRINEKIEERYFFRELGVNPPGKFKIMLIRKITEAMNKYGPVYEEIVNGLDLTGTGGDSYKERTIHSEYPQSQLQPSSQDYASGADDSAREATTKRGSLEAILVYNEGFIEPDAAVLDYIAPCFSNFLSFNF